MFVLGGIYFRIYLNIRRMLRHLFQMNENVGNYFISCEKKIGKISYNFHIYEKLPRKLS